MIRACWLRPEAVLISLVNRLGLGISTSHGCGLGLWVGALGWGSGLGLWVGVGAVAVDCEWF